MTVKASANQSVASKVASEPNNTPEPSLPVFKPNKNLPSEKIYDINKKISKEALRQKNAKLEKVELITFEEGYKRLGKEAKLNPQISPDRLV